VVPVVPEDEIPLRSARDGARPMTPPSRSRSGPSLLQKTDLIKRKLGLSGNVPAVATTVAQQLGVDATAKTTAAVINECYQQILSAKAIPQAGEGAPRQPASTSTRHRRDRGVSEETEETEAPEVSLGGHTLSLERIKLRQDSSSSPASEAISAQMRYLQASEKSISEDLESSLESPPASSAPKTGLDAEQSRFMYMLRV
jgi:hypothetical protein